MQKRYQGAIWRLSGEAGRMPWGGFPKKKMVFSMQVKGFLHESERFFCKFKWVFLVINRFSREKQRFSS
jgi:hypothetical protein